LEPGERRCNVFRAGREADNRAPAKSFELRNAAMLRAWGGEVLGQMGWNREKPVDELRKT
jgi:hypothetical protein